MAAAAPPLTAAPAGAAAVARLADVSQRYAAAWALRDVALDIPARCLVGLVGPDGVGKSTLLGLIAGVRRIQRGRVEVLGGDMRQRRHRRRVCPRIAYLPQGLGQNLYADLSAAENVDFFGRLFGVAAAERERRGAALLASTGLSGVAARRVAVLSGGMRQKLGLCCALIHDPDLLVLDEPTTGVDPLSRHQFWELIAAMRSRRPDLSVVAATVYMEEAERFDWLVLLDGGRVLAMGSPAELAARAGVARIEDAYVALLPAGRRRGYPAVPPPPRAQRPAETVIAAQNLTRRFGAITAVDRVSFDIRRGEIFGFVGPNGSGKTTTLQMLTGLLPPTAGEARLLGRPVQEGDVARRRLVGYMSQTFSLYGELTVRQNLMLQGRLFDLAEADLAARLPDLARRLGLDTVLDVRAEHVALGLRQRLSLAVAVIHGPEVLMLDEPTAGVDPVARGQLWRFFSELSRERGVTILVSTHYLDEAERCDRVALMSAGRLLACDAPASLRAAHGASSLEAVFLRTMREETGDDAPPAAALPVPAGRPAPSPRPARAAAGRLWAQLRREVMELWRDRAGLLFAALVPPLLLVVYGYGYSFDIERLPYAVLDRDRSPQSRELLRQFSGSRYFAERPPPATPAELERRFQGGDLKVAIEVPPGFGRDLARGRRPGVAVWVDGTLPFRAEIARGYVLALEQRYLAELARGGSPREPALAIETRYRYNPELETRRAVVPGLLAVVLAIVPALLAGVAIARDKELGTIANLQATPARPFEYFLGKQGPLVLVSLAGLAALLAVAVVLFGVPLRGSLAAFLLGATLYVMATTALGLVISTVAQTQAAGLVAAAIVTIIPAFLYSGLIRPVTTLTGTAAIIARIFPAAYFRDVSVATFTKGLGGSALVADYAALAAIAATLSVAGVLLTRKQAR